MDTLQSLSWLDVSLDSCLPCARVRVETLESARRLPFGVGFGLVVRSSIQVGAAPQRARRVLYFLSTYLEALVLGRNCGIRWDLISDLPECFPCSSAKRVGGKILESLFVNLEPINSSFRRPGILLDIGTWEFGTEVLIIRYALPMKLYSRNRLYPRTLFQHWWHRNRGSSSLKTALTSRENSGHVYHHTNQNRTIGHDTTQCNATQHHVMQYNATQYNIIQSGEMQCHIVYDTIL